MARQPGEHGDNLRLLRVIVSELAANRVAIEKLAMELVELASLVRGTHRGSKAPWQPTKTYELPKVGGSGKRIDRRTDADKTVEG